MLQIGRHLTNAECIMQQLLLHYQVIKKGTFHRDRDREGERQKDRDRDRDRDRQTDRQTDRTERTDRVR